MHDRYLSLTERFTEYKTMMQGLSQYAQDKKYLEQINDGLLILEAYYGDINSINLITKDHRPIEPLPGNIKEYSKCQAIDVKDLLQIMVSNGMLLITKAFSDYPGLIDPLIRKNRKKALYIKMKHKGLERQVVINLNDNTPLMIPRDIY